MVIAQNIHGLSHKLLDIEDLFNRSQSEQKQGLEQLIQVSLARVRALAITHRLP